MQLQIPFSMKVIAILAILAESAFAQTRPLPKVVSTGADQTLRVWGADGKEVQNILAHDATVTAIAVSSDGKIAFTASADRAIKGWNLEDGTKASTLEGHSQEVTCIALSPDGRILASG